MKKVLVLIPARYASTRFPGKPLAPIAGQSLIQRVWQNAQGANALSSDGGLSFEVAVATDSAEITDHVEAFGGQALRVDDAVATGSERVYLAWKRFKAQGDFQLVANLQGDEPLFAGGDLRRLVDFHLNSDFDIATMAIRRENREWNDPHQVKVAWNSRSGRCLYFSRAPVPFDREGGQGANPVKKWWQHVGVYSFRPKALELFANSPAGECERSEQLEQLRALEGGMSIGACELERDLVGVDVPADIPKVEALLWDK